ncbi:MAG: hypothetical protein DI626_06730 [Micavibrio aeruginosavorus]|uniref:Uncharacterized protein n=1 Tax=Micavibrio aeruginosavorus TaxID=349221 RepID=A0A2W4ZYB1_9BACT|nr:MAG: hypothetical protein DI626_06730 [Micavibrio aeruginosavorus]
MSITYTPEELRHTGQTVPTQQLVRILKLKGFDIRPVNGSSHIFCIHSNHSDLAYTIVKGTKKLASQREIAKILMELDRRESAGALSGKFNTAAADDAFAALPPHIEIERDHAKGVTVLRDKNIPQIGVTLDAGEERLAENKVRYIESLKREAFVLLNRCRVNYDIVGNFDHGVFGGTLSHKVYDLKPMKIAPYTAGENSDKIFEKINTFTNNVMARDTEHRERLEKLLTKNFISEVAVTFHARRGERVNHVSVIKPSGESLSLTFETQSHRRASKSDVHSGRIREQALGRLEKTILGIERAHGAHQQVFTG